MLTRFNLYDIFGTFIPGAIPLVGVMGFLAAVRGSTLEISGILSSLLFVPVAYVLGTLIHQIRHIFTGFPKYSIIYIKKESVSPLSSQFIKEWESLVKETMSFEVDKSKDKSIQNAFYLCYYDSIQEGNGVYVENFNSLYGMCKNLQVSFLFLTVTVLIYILTEAPTGHDLYISSSCFILSVFLPTILQRGAHHFGRNFALSVFRSFYVSKADRPPEHSVQLNHGVDGRVLQTDD